MLVLAGIWLAGGGAGRGAALLAGLLAGALLPVAGLPMAVPELLATLVVPLTALLVARGARSPAATGILVAAMLIHGLVSGHGAAAASGSFIAAMTASSAFLLGLCSLVARLTWPAARHRLAVVAEQTGIRRSR